MLKSLRLVLVLASLRLVLMLGSLRVALILGSIFNIKYHLLITEEPIQRSIV